MTKLSKILGLVAAVVKLGAAVGAVFIGCYESYQHSHQSGNYSYSAHDSSGDYGYGGSYGWDYRGFGHGRGRSEFGGYDRRR